jgi:hypothetical protein
MTENVETVIVDEVKSDKRTFIAYDADLFDKEGKLVPLRGKKGSVLKYSGKYPKDAATKLASRGYENIIVRETNDRRKMKRYSGSIIKVTIEEDKMLDWMKESPDAITDKKTGKLTIDVKKGLAKYVKPKIDIPKGTRLLDEE